MEQNLEDWLKDSHSLPEQLRLVAGIAAAVDQAHSESEVRPGIASYSVTVFDDGRCGLTDFGATPPPGWLKNGAGYVAPEIHAGGRYAASADIFAAGVLFYEVLAGHNPFAAGAAAVAEVQPTPLREVRTDVPRDLCDAITACLDKDPEWRPKDLSFILSCSLQAAGSTSAAPAPSKAAKQQPKAAPAAVPSIASAGSGVLSSYGAKKDTPASKTPLIAGVLTLVAVVGGVGFWFMNRTGGAPPKPADKPKPEAMATPTPAKSEEVAPSAAPTQEKAAEKTPATEAPRATPTPVPERVQEAKAAAPVVTRPVAPIETPEPTVAPTVPPVTAAPATTLPAAPLEPAALTNVTPPTLKRGGTRILDVRGTNLRDDARPVILHGKETAASIGIVRQRLMNPGLLQVVINVPEDATTGAYTLALADTQGHVTNSVRFEVAK
jgi:serine/threonine-protein kinase